MVMQRAPRPVLSLPIEPKVQSKLYFTNQRNGSERGAFELVKPGNKPGDKPIIKPYGAICTSPQNCATVSDKRSLKYLGPILGYIVKYDGKGKPIEQDARKVASKVAEIKRAIKSGLMLGRVRLSINRGTIVSTPNKGKVERWADIEQLAEAMLLNIV